MAKKLVFTLMMLCLVLPNVLALPIQITPEEAKGIWRNGNTLYLVDSIRIMYGEGEDWLNDDRTFLEYDISAFEFPMEQVTLNILNILNLDDDPPDGVIDVYTYIADGIVTISDFDSGGPLPYTSFMGSGGGFDVSIDVTSFVNSAISTDQQYIGFRLSTRTADRYLLSGVLGAYQPDPFLTVIPEPCTVLLFGIGAVLLRGRRRV